MTGRYALTASPASVRAIFGYREEADFPPRTNIAPTQPVVVIRQELDSPDPLTRHLRLVRWGFVPGFAKNFDAFRPVVNAPAEDVREKPSFRNAFRRRRCLVPADAFYLWQKRGREPSQPHLVRLADGSTFGMAGLVETWVGADGSELDTGCIVSRPAFAATSKVHGRAPVIIPPDSFALWLDPDERTAGDAAELLSRDPDLDFQVFPIGPAINKPGFDDPSVQEPVGPALLRPARPVRPAQGELF